MKNLTKLFLILMISLVSYMQSTGQTGWYYINPIPTSEDYNAMQIFSNGTGYASCIQGSVLKTTNNGANWFYYPDENTFFKNYSIGYFSLISFLNSQTGYLVNNKRIFKTTNAALNWTLVGTSLMLDGLYDFDFKDSLNGFSSRYNGILKTSNGGLNWSVISLPTQIRNIENNFYFINKNVGIYIDTKHRIMRTSDAGNSWTKIVDSTNTIELRSVFFLNELTGYVGGDSAKIFKTTNAGLNWQIISTNLGSATRIDRFQFINENTGYYLNFQPMKTTNGGSNWSSAGPSLVLTPKGIYFDNFGNGIAYGYFGGMYRTTNDGNSWYNNSSVLDHGWFTDFIFFNVTTGYFTALNGWLLKTTNGGSSFDKHQLTNKNLNSINTLANNNIYIGGDSILLKSSNGGINWISYPVNLRLASISFLNEVKGYGKSVISTSQGNIYTNIKTTNGGLNWQDAEIGGSIYFFDEFNGICIAGQSNFPSPGGYTITYKTTNGGESWIQINYLNGFIFDRVSFLNSTIAYANTSDDLFKTSNGGYNWEQISHNTSGIYAMTFVNELTGYGAGRKTTNGGVNWFSQNSSPVSKFWFGNVNTGYSISEGSIRKTTDGGSTNVEVINISSEIPDKIIFHQNYPNPFNPNTVIRYQLSVAGFTTLKVFDLLGKEVTTLVNEKQNAGSYAVDFNSTEFNLPSGIYFYTLNAVEFKETKKMVLIK